MHKAIRSYLHVVLILVLGPGLALAGAARARRGGHSRGARPQATTGTVAGQSRSLLPDGRVLLVGGEGPDGPLATASVQDLKTGAITALPVKLLRPRAWHTATILPDGTVLVAGGIGPG